ncbi:MmcQ/YjbR family DNA-binding protein [Sphingosinicella sp.]|uniref:MmcQ/YjbR family DNA-binding protein n=1 Tax=Sphingosinicella sp. TaxID=1917971 RepID=UPI0040382A0F
MSGKTDALVAELRAFGLAFPGAHRKAPWPDHDDLAVNDKTFAYLPAMGSERFMLSVKLPYTGPAALDLPFAVPTGYGLGRSGWVSFMPTEDEMPALDQWREWLEESYRAQAPKRLVKELDARG